APALTLSVVALVWIAIAGSTTVTMTSALARPVPEDRMIAVPFTDLAVASALTVTFWKVLKLVGVKVNVAPPATVTPAFPAARATFTVTLVACADAILAAHSVVAPALTLSVVTLVWIAIAESTTVTVTSALVRPVPDDRMIAVPFAELAVASALTVTFWKV